MATRFEIALWGGDPDELRLAASEALDEVRRIDRQLSFYNPASDLSDLNSRAATELVQLDPRLFALLQEARDVWELTGGAFDVTVGPLMRAWGLSGGSPGPPSPEALAEALSSVGLNKLELNPEDFTARFLSTGMSIDLGAIGKGYALKLAGDLLVEAAPGGALLHGGTSSVRGMGLGPDSKPWRVAVQHPTIVCEVVAEVELENASLSVSAPHGKSFTHEGQSYGHVIDPRNGLPTSETLLAAVVCESATRSDALSTALLVVGPRAIDLARTQWGANWAMVVHEGPHGIEVTGG